MLGRLLARRRALTVGAGVALAGVVAGCTSTATNSAVTAIGKTLTIYVSRPPVGAGNQTTQDVLDAERLALEQAGGKAGGFTVKLAQLDGKKISDNARTAIQDSSAIAYLGEIVPGTSADSIGITNDRDLLQVSPTDTAVALTQSTGAVANSPTLYYEALKTYGQTFARLVPNTSLEAKALVSEMQARGIKRLYATADGSAYGNALLLAVTNDAPGASVAVKHSQAGADGVLYAGSSHAGAAQLFNSAAASDAAVRLFGPSALADQEFAAALSGAAAKRVELSSPGFLPSGLPTTAQTQFVIPFKRTFGHAPATQAIFGYEAMAAVLAVLQKAGSAANNRSIVVHDFLGNKNRQSVIGTYSIDSGGDTNLGAFVISKISGGQLVPFKAVSETR